MKNLIALASATLLTIGLFSCHKNADPVQPLKPQSHSVARAITQSYANSNNPYDYIGALHNQGCDFFVQNGANKDNIASNAIELGQQFVNSQNLEGADAVTPILSSDYATNIIGVTGENSYTSEQIFSNMLNQEAITEQQYTYLLQMNDLINSVPQIGQENDDDVEKVYSIVYDGFVAIESDIMANVQDADQQRTLLAAAAVGRYSVGYWMSHASDPNSPWGDVVPSAMTAAGVGKADLATAAGASVTWGIYTAWIGGGIGWGATVVAGGIGGSVAKILEGW